MRLKILAAAMLIAGLTIGLTLFFGCTPQSQDQTAAPDSAPADEMPPADQQMQEHDDEQAGHGPGMREETHEMGEHHESEQHHGQRPEIDTENLELSGEMQDGVRVVEVSARQFEFEPETIVLKQGQPARLLVTSEDVAHGFDIEGMDIDVELPPNETKTIEFTPNQAGQHHFYCSVYCGPGHEDMHGTLVVKE